MDANEPVNIRTLRETAFAETLRDDLNLNFGYQYSPMSAVIEHICREVDERTLFRLHEMRTGLFSVASLEFMLEARLRDMCFCYNDEDGSEMIILPCCGKRYHTTCIDRCDKCPNCRKEAPIVEVEGQRPQREWIGFESRISYFTWVRWSGRIHRRLSIDPARAIFHLVQALRGPHSDKLKYDAVSMLSGRTSLYSARMEDEGLRETLADLIHEDHRLDLGKAATRLFIRLCQAAAELFRNICQIKKDNMLIMMLEDDADNGPYRIERALKILRHDDPAALAPFADRIVTLTDHTDPHVRKEALSVFRILDKKVLGKYIPVVVAMLSKIGDETKQMAAQVLTALSDYYTDKTIAAIVQAGAIPPLVEMLSANYIDEIKIAATEALYNLTMSEKFFDEENDFPYNENNIVAIAQAGAINPLVMMLSSGTDDAKTSATWLLRNLSSDKDNHADLARDIPTFVLLLKADADELQQSACAFLSILATNDDYKKAIREAGAIPILVAMLIQGSTNQAAAATTLKFLAKDNGDNKDAIKQAGAIPHLIAMLTVGLAEREEAIYALEQLGEEHPPLDYASSQRQIVR